MEKFTELCQYAWVIMMLVAFVVCWAKGWMRKGFYLTTRQAEEKEALEKLEKEKGKKEDRDALHKFNIKNKITADQTK